MTYRQRLKPGLQKSLCGRLLHIPSVRIHTLNYLTVDLVVWWCLLLGISTQSMLSTANDGILCSTSVSRPHTRYRRVGRLIIAVVVVDLLLDDGSSSAVLFFDLVLLMPYSHLLQHLTPSYQRSSHVPTKPSLFRSPLRCLCGLA